MLVERQAYHAVGGHAAIRDRIHDALQLARLVRARGLPTDLVAGARLARCRMYGGFAEAWAGFAKNAHEGMARPVGPADLDRAAGRRASAAVGALGATGQLGWPIAIAFAVLAPALADR